MQKKGFSLSFETIIILIIVMIVLIAVLIFLFGNYSSLFDKFSQQANATSSLADNIQIPKP